MNKLILASASPRRRELLEQIGMTFEVIPSDIEEKTKSHVPCEMVMELSSMKAMDIFEKLPSEKRASVIVAGADTVVAFGDCVMGKPADKEKAQEMLSLLQGKTHQVYTGVTLVWQEEEGHPPAKFVFYEETDVSMYPMSEQEICSYVETKEPMDKAGAYGIQGKCAAFIRGICGDYYNVVGLPIGRLYQELKKINDKDRKS
ncbi:MAG: Maf family protein [Lachnospiraceae bacterium]|nr:Maf family protein [Lachnospiraceae bacterium]MDE6186412.1 Maf family protein [Lachnospiraceae bacterium]